MWNKNKEQKIIKEHLITLTWDKIIAVKAQTKLATDQKVW